MSGNVIPAGPPDYGRGYYEITQSDLTTEASGTNGYEIACRIVNGDGNSDGLDSVIRPQHIAALGADVVGVELIVESPSSSGTPFDSVDGPVGLDILWFADSHVTGNPHYLLFAKRGPDEDYVYVPRRGGSVQLPSNQPWLPVSWSDVPDVYASSRSDIFYYNLEYTKDLPSTKTPGAAFWARYSGESDQFTPQGWMRAIGNFATGVLFPNGSGLFADGSGLIFDTNSWKIYASRVDFKPQGSGVTIDVKASSIASIIGQRMDTIMGPHLVQAGLTPNVPHITTRNHFRMKDGNVERRSLFTADQYDAVEFTSDKIPGQSPSPAPYDGTGSTPDVLIVFVHGIWVEAKSAVETFETARNAFQHNISQYSLNSKDDYRFIGYSWDSDIGTHRRGLGWSEANKIATFNGPKLGEFIREYKKTNSKTYIHLVAHSLGGRVVFEALKYLSEKDFTHTDKGALVNSVVLLGGAVRTSDVESDGKYFESIQQAAGGALNFYYPGDNVLKWLFGPGEAVFSPDSTAWERILSAVVPHVAFANVVTKAVTIDPIGLNGCSETAAQKNWTDISADLNVTGFEESHTTYYDKNGGCIDQVVGFLGSP